MDLFHFPTVFLWGCTCDGLSCLRCTEWNVSPPNIFHQACSFRLPASPRNKHNHRRTNTFSHFTNVDGLSCVFSAFSLSSSVSLRSPLNIINLSPTPPHPLYCNDITISFNFSPISPSALAELLELQETGHISSSVAKQVGQLQTTRNYPLLFDTGSATSGSATARHMPLPQLNIPGFALLSGFPGDVEVVGKDSQADHPGEGFRPCEWHHTAAQHLPEGGGLEPRRGAAYVQFLTHSYIFFQC